MSVGRGALLVAHYFSATRLVIIYKYKEAQPNSFYSSLYPMSLSKPLPPFTYDLLRFLNRDQLDRFAIVSRSLKNLIERYFLSKPCRVFERLGIWGGSYALLHKNVQWHPNQNNYSVQQFLDGQKSSIDESGVPGDDRIYYSFAEMHPYLGLPVRIKTTAIFVDGESTNNPEHIAEMESMSYLWRDHCLIIGKVDESRIVAEDIQLILNSPTILQCRFLAMARAHFSFKNYKVLNTVNVFEIAYAEADVDIDLNHWQQFLEQPGAKPVVALGGLRREIIDNALDRLKQAFSSAVSPNAYKIVFVQVGEPLTEFRETNKTSREVLELKKGLPVEYPEECAEDFNHQNFDHYTLKRCSV
ncbi:hypothetical protein Ddc_17215 [Ditylenchus destructor]|nr:hypothetical protein Ddc_17215 [Ditylenchus destructor]